METRWNILEIDVYVTVFLSKIFELFEAIISYNKFR